MIESTDMSTPVTRGELQDTLGLFKQELKQELSMERQQEIQAAVAPLPTRTELHHEIQTAVAPLATKAELQAAIAPLATKAELDAAVASLATKAELQAAIAPLATRAELDLWGGALVARIQHGEQRLDHLLERFDQTERRWCDAIRQSEQRVIQEVARHTSAAFEAMQTQIKAMFEPLADLPERVSRLEAAVFGPTPSARRTRRRKH